MEVEIFGSASAGACRCRPRDMKVMFCIKINEVPIYDILFHSCTAMWTVTSIHVRQSFDRTVQLQALNSTKISKFNSVNKSRRSSMNLIIQVSIAIDSNFLSIITHAVNLK